MQFAIGMEARIALGTSAIVMPRIPDANRTLAEVRIRFLDKDDNVTFTSRQQLVAGGRVGARDGYETLRGAIADLATKTAGERPAAVVLERGGRYFGHYLKGRDLEQGFRSPAKRLHLEEDGRSQVMELRATDRHERVRALVDGAWMHRFRTA